MSASSASEAGYSSSIRVEAADKPLVLIVDDNRELLMVLKAFLERNDLRVRTAPSGISALEVLAQVTPDLIVCDILMPKMDGYEFQKRILNDPKLSDVPFLFLTALSGEDEIRYGHQLGCDEYLTKPFDLEDLCSIVKGKLILAKHRARMSKERTGEANRRIIHTLSHEFRTPLVSINTGTELLLEKREELPPDQFQQLLQMIWRGGERLERLVNDFMLLQQIDLGQAARMFELYRQRVSLNSIIDVAVQGFKEMVVPGENCAIEQLAGAEKRTGASSDEDIWVEVYDPHIVSVIQRLLSNAQKFGGEHAITISVTKSGDRAYVTVRDRGPGMDATHVEQLMRGCEPFTQFKRELLEQQGCGLGLTIGRRLAQINQGTLSFKRPDDGIGLEAIMSLPFSA